NRYLDGFPEDSRAVRDARYFKTTQISDERLEIVRALNRIAENRNQTLAQMAVAWLLIDPRVTSVLIGASKVEQIDDNVAALNHLSFSEEEMRIIRNILE